MPTAPPSVESQLRVEKGIDIRQPSTALFGISSADRFSISRITQDPGVAEWDAVKRYSVGNVVYYAPYGRNYRCLVANIGNAPPAPSASPSTFWAVLPVSAVPPTWDPAITYDVGDIVLYNNRAYASLITANLGNDPELTLDADWEYTEIVGANYTSRPGGTSPFAFNLQSGQNFLTGFFTRIALTEVNFTYAIPTITARNDKIGFRYKIGAAATRVVPWFGIVNGWYDGASLATELQRAIRTLDAGLSTFTMTFNTTTGSLVGTAPAGTTWCFVPVDVVYGGGSNPQTKAEPDRIQLYDQLSWAANTSTNASIGPGYVLANQQVSGPISLCSTKFIDITCGKLTALQTTRDGDTGGRPRDVLARVYFAGNVVDQPADGVSIIGSAPFTIYHDYATPKQIHWDPEVPLNQLFFEIYDDQGLLLGTLGTSTWATPTSTPVWTPTSPTNQIYNDANQPDWTITLLATEI